MTNIERAAGIIRAMVKIENQTHDTDVAQALDADGLLMPDLPEPTMRSAHNEPRWIACDTEIETAGYEQRVLVHDVDISWDLSLDDARDLAYALLAAANYAERNQA